MTRYQDDFYDAINGEWEKTAVIPADKSRTGGFIDLDEEIEELMLTTTDKWLAGEDVPEDPILANFVKYHRMVRDFDKREADGIEPVLPLLKEYQDLKSFADFTSKLAEFELAGKPNFLPIGVSPDFMDARTNVLWAGAPGTILPDTTYYAEDHPQREELLTLWKESSANLLKAYDFSDEEIEDLLEKRLELDRRIAAVVLSNEESSEYAKLYHPYAYEDFKKFAPALPLDDFFQAVLGQVPDKVIVDEERFWQAADQFYSE